MNRLELRPVLVGAAVAAASATVIALLLRFVSETSNLGFAIFAAVMLCMVVGGYLAARAQTELAFTAGAAAAAIAAVAVQVLDFLFRLARGSEVKASFVIGSVFVLLLSCSFGVVGGAVALWRERRSSATHEEAST